MNENERIRKVCRAFGEALAEHLIGNGKGIEWPCADESFLAMRAAQEIEELRYEVDYVGRGGAVKESLDVAAYVMMIWDNMKKPRDEAEK